MKRTGHGEWGGQGRAIVCDSPERWERLTRRETSIAHEDPSILLSHWLLSDFYMRSPHFSMVSNKLKRFENMTVKHIRWLNPVWGQQFSKSAADTKKALQLLGRYWPDHSFAQVLWETERRDTQSKRSSTKPMDEWQSILSDSRTKQMIRDKVWFGSGSHRTSWQTEEKRKWE